MNFFELFSFFVLCSFAAGCQLTASDVEGYYWRDYRGKVPNDAVLAGINGDGKKIYIGQALHIAPSNGKLIPGKIVEGQKNMSYVWGDSKEEHVITKNIKILCTHHPENIKWTDVSYGKLSLISQVDFIVGGYDTTYDLYIGRIRREDDVGVGKITLLSPDKTFGYSDENGKTVWTSGGFEVLSYIVRYDNRPNSGCHTLHSGEKVININIS